MYTIYIYIYIYIYTYIHIYLLSYLKTSTNKSRKYLFTCILASRASLDILCGPKTIFSVKNTPDAATLTQHAFNSVFEPFQNKQEETCSKHSSNYHGIFFVWGHSLVSYFILWYMFARYVFHTNIKHFPVCCEARKLGRTWPPGSGFIITFRTPARRPGPPYRNDFMPLQRHEIVARASIKTNIINNKINNTTL